MSLRSVLDFCQGGAKRDYLQLELLVNYTFDPPLREPDGKRLGRDVALERLKDDALHKGRIPISTCTVRMRLTHVGSTIRSDPPPTV